MSTFLAAQGLSFSYDSSRVLNNFTLEVRQGEIFGLLGPNGSGKSTFLKLLAGLDRPASGSFSFQGETFVSPTRRFRESIGVVFQSPALDDKLTAVQNLQLAARIHGIPRSEWDQRIREMLENIGLADRSTDPVGTFSGGMKRRLDLGRALLHRPALLLMDEPTSGLDEASFRGLWKMLNSMKTKQTLTVLVATHRPEEGEMCDRIAVIHGGGVSAVNTPDELKQGLAPDIVTLHSTNPEEVTERLSDLAGVKVTSESDSVHLECDEGAQMIAAVANRVPRDLITRYQLRQPGLGDAFMKLTGDSLTQDNEGTE